ncbi:MAG: radical SAM family heme chaperone HemW [Lachnospiraceae bacterium]|nr:radical SAM family heme chaperone HemW [Lachnospiraceae bacterium]
MSDKRSLGIYIHIPFCKQKCKYCDFLSFPIDDEVIKDAYVDALVYNIKEQAKVCSDRYIVDTIYIGGGTPSLLSFEQIQKICTAISTSFSIDEDYEWTMEVNPNSAGDAVKLMMIRKAGINRLSIGAQATCTRTLTTLGRIHTAEDIFATYEAACKAGFTNINIDLMYGIFGQTVEEFAKSLEDILYIAPEHLSAYQLIIEEGTPFYDLYHSGQATLPSEEDIAKMEEILYSWTQLAGMTRYEISNFAKPGHESRHNLRYWRMQDYLAIGLGASGFIFGDPGLRSENTKDLQEYLERPTSGTITQVPLENEMEEFCFLGLRMMEEGIDCENFRERFGRSVETVYPPAMFERFIQQGLMIKKYAPREAYVLTPRGADVSNMIMAEFIN